MKTGFDDKAHQHVPNSESGVHKQLVSMLHAIVSMHRTGSGIVCMRIQTVCWFAEVGLQTAVGLPVSTGGWLAAVGLGSAVCRPLPCLTSKFNTREIMFDPITYLSNKA